MDLAMPVMDGIEATRRIKEANQDIRVLMLTSIDHEDNIYAALAAGADGYCLKEAKADVIELAIRAVHKGTVWLDPAIAGRIL
ncbi:response regulator, partial [Enterococcus faecium]